MEEGLFDQCHLGEKCEQDEEKRRGYEREWEKKQRQKTEEFKLKGKIKGKKQKLRQKECVFRSDHGRIAKGGEGYRFFV